MTNFLYDGQKLLQEDDGTGATTVTYTSTGGSVYDPLLSERRGTASQFPLYDALGSVRILLDAAQNLVDGYAYDAFGNQVSGGNDANPYRYVGAFGYYLDGETGLDLLTYRFYDSAIGRFLTRDPIGFFGGDWNLYGYVKNRSIVLADGDGLQCPDRDCDAEHIKCLEDVARMGMKLTAECFGSDLLGMQTVECLAVCGLASFLGGVPAFKKCSAICAAATLGANTYCAKMTNRLIAEQRQSCDCAYAYCTHTRVPDFCSH